MLSIRVIAIVIFLLAKGSQACWGVDLNGIWKLTSAEYLRIDTSIFPPKVVKKTYPLSAVIADPLTGYNEDRYMEINSDKCIIYMTATKSGESSTVYFRTTFAARCSSSSCIVENVLPGLPSISDPTMLMLGKGDHLISTLVINDNKGRQPKGGSATTIQFIYNRYHGQFPPSNWPQKMIDLNVAAENLKNTGEFNYGADN
ncbi:MAG TPA: hypothetical protein VK448_04700 [Dissulfurispiraceae bacterium]|nr:hypothetical protein [Dissulfurispiraceae bacterium]